MPPALLKKMTKEIETYDIDYALDYSYYCN